MYRQGDLLLVAVQDLPPALVPVAGRLILARGERTGHVHEVLQTDRARLWRDGLGSLWLEAKATGVELQHEEHRPVAIAPGFYAVRRQRVFTSRARVRAGAAGRINSVYAVNEPGIAWD